MKFCPELPDQGSGPFPVFFPIKGIRSIKMKYELDFPLHLDHLLYNLNGPMGNAFVIMGTTQNVRNQVMLAAGYSGAEIKVMIWEYLSKATSGNYENLLAVTKEYVLYNWYRGPFDSSEDGDWDDAEEEDDDGDWDENETI